MMALSTSGLSASINVLHLRFTRTSNLGPFACELYGCAGSLFGCASIWSMTMIAFDRYNVIVKGIAAQPMTKNGALTRILAIWAFSLAWTLAPFFGWNRFVMLPVILTF